MGKGSEKGGKRGSSASPSRSKGEVSELGGRTVYCGNLAWSVSWQDLKDHLKTIGAVEFCEVLQYRDGRKTGSGIARFEKQEDADKAIEQL